MVKRKLTEFVDKEILVIRAHLLNVLVNNLANRLMYSFFVKTPSKFLALLLAFMMDVTSKLNVHKTFI